MQSSVYNVHNYFCIQTLLECTPASNGNKDLEKLAKISLLPPKSQQSLSDFYLRNMAYLLYAQGAQDSRSKH